MKIKNYFKHKIPKLYFFSKKIYYYFYNNYFFRKSYSLEGEDLVLNNFLDKKIGFYVDVGAHHPRKFSNTYFFYKKGWNGINIDAMPGSMKIFSIKRKRDINLEIPISSIKENLVFHIFEEPAYNTFSKKLAERNIGITKLLKKITLTTKKLSEVLDQYVAHGQEIDFFSIDVEGFDFQILQSNDWSKYRPNFILIEEHNFDLENIKNSKIFAYLHEQGYYLHAKTGNTVFFKLLK